MDSMSLTCSVARKAVIRNTHKGHQGGLAQEYRASFKQVQRSRMAALRATLRAKARASVPALRQLERRPVFLHCRALPRKLSLWLNTSNSLNPCTSPPCGHTSLSNSRANQLFLILCCQEHKPSNTKTCVMSYSKESGIGII